jgi:hypothetical protein
MTMERTKEMVFQMDIDMAKEMVKLLKWLGKDSQGNGFGCGQGYG